ncbi:MAG: hypothetical protein ACRCRW_03425 [Aeromonadaceae bacterium]
MIPPRPISASLFSLFIAVALLAAGCDYFEDTSPKNLGQVSVTGDEGLLVGEGVMHVQGHRIAVRLGRVSVDERDYGGVPEGAEVYFRASGAFQQLLVNGEEQGPTKRP